MITNILIVINYLLLKHLHIKTPSSNNCRLTNHGKSFRRYSKGGEALFQINIFCIDKFYFNVSMPVSLCLLLKYCKTSSFI